MNWRVYFNLVCVRFECVINRCKKCSAGRFDLMYTDFYFFLLLLTSHQLANNFKLWTSDSTFSILLSDDGNLLMFIFVFVHKTFDSVVLPTLRPRFLQIEIEIFYFKFLLSSFIIINIISKNISLSCIAWNNACFVVMSHPILSMYWASKLCAETTRLVYETAQPP